MDENEFWKLVDEPAAPSADERQRAPLGGLEAIVYVMMSTDGPTVASGSPTSASEAITDKLVEDSRDGHDNRQEWRGAIKGPSPRS